MKTGTIFFVISLFVTFNLHAQTLQLYGGKDHDQYLGCLNCNEFDTSSIWNKFGDYGLLYGTNSIWNDFGTYGSSYSDFSPFSSAAQNPPSIVDGDGGFYGYLTINSFNVKRSDNSIAVAICEHWKAIKANIPEWYKKIFNR
jgi:hypothetical protein